ncbi:hypothetical protein LBMAG21_03690 [Armatimonadota bacterium]|nr:hypothetical protein LBMAG21_03690 [Armatimonadota bacterium]
MRRIVVVIVGITFISCLGFLFIKQKKSDTDPVAEAVMANPTTAQIRQSLQGTITLNSGETQEDAKRRIFSTLFKKRFREFNPTIAVGMRFDNATSVRLYFPARLEPYYRDRIAYTAWREIKELLGVSCGITLWDTYIGLPPAKTGELKPVAGSPDRVHIIHNFMGQHVVQ